MKRFLATGAVLAIGALCALAPPIGAQAPTSLNGERLTCEAATTGSSCAFVNGSAATDCVATSSAVFTATGVATGPYAGSFREDGAVQYASIADPSVDFFGPRPITAFSATFTIQSAAGQVTGTKRLPTTTETTGRCQFIGDFEGAVIDSSMCYEARLPTGDTEHGVAQTFVATFNREGQQFTQEFAETFTSKAVDPARYTALCVGFPTSKDQCKNEGWRTFAPLGFKNEGDCVSYVATRGKNLPG